ncbi:aldo-keto reductase dtxS3 [Trichoderma asperellum]|uniref:Aldo-keto reductase dtxS3 n=1 Tax=Trichoderma asperellum TaxID=101201 RepID=A0A6V8R5X4_TRIAP|nr:aldo-keto reductase dtxS3 [Trichoderma asperellum]
MAPSLPPSLQKSLDESQVEYVRLGTSGLRVSVPILGAMSFGSSQWLPWVLDEDDSIEMLKAAYDRGLNTWDTADMYSNGISEEIIGKALKQHSIPRERVVIMTKCFIAVADQPDIFAGLSRTAIFKAVDASLQRLGTDYIDLFMVHRFDPSTPIEETMRALHDLVVSGKIRYIGASSMWATQFARMQSVAEQNGWTKFISMQNYYNLCYREEEREMNRYCNETGVGIMPWSPNFGGKLARPLGEAASTRAQAPSPTGNSLTKADEDIIRRVEELAVKKDWKMSQISLSWLRSKGAVPIVGLNSLLRLEEACELRGKDLTVDEIKFLEEPYVPKNIVGHI